VTTGDSRRAAAPADAPRTKLLTFQSWVTQAAWHRYALQHPDLIPFQLIDRSPCQDPFFDPFAAPDRRRPVISGLCRAIRNFRVGDRFIYIARVDRRVARRLGIVDAAGPRYFAVAALRVVRVWESHQIASTDFTPRQYVAVPPVTPYPPNLAFANHPEAAAARVCSIIHDENDRWHLPDDATDRMWRRQYLGYRTRQIRRRLRAAECEVERVDGRECLQLLPGRAPLVTPEWWGGVQMNVMGHPISEEFARPIRIAIAITTQSQ
jgi:hypothetical protein